MKLYAPFIITARLLPGLRVAGAFISMRDVGRNGEGRTVYEYWIDLPGGIECRGSDLKSGCGGGTLVEGFESLLTFLGSVSDDHENSLFPDAVTHWAIANADEIATAHLELCDAMENGRALLE